MTTIYLHALGRRGQPVSGTALGTTISIDKYGDAPETTFLLAKGGELNIYDMALTDLSEGRAVARSGGGTSVYLHDVHGPATVTAKGPQGQDVQISVAPMIARDGWATADYYKLETDPVTGDLIVEPGVNHKVIYTSQSASALDEIAIAAMHNAAHGTSLGELHFPKERLMAQVFGTRLAELLETRWPGLRIEGGWADMAGEHGSSQAADENHTWNLLVGRAGGFRVRPQRIGTNRIQPRLEAVRAALEAPIHAGRTGLLIDPSCAFLIAGFEARYVWTDEVNAQGDKRKVPDKSLTEANVMDALQYLLLSEHKADGTSVGSFPGQPTGLIGHNGGPPLSGGESGLRTGFDVLNPYGGR
ncbi:hypothetical protein [Paracoccus sp. SSK6]|uniref:hypothetical protein n=1 Tax=Paracoccus sp. SSK6 TaxID=3143131 RepID=UPI00321A006B